MDDNGVWVPEACTLPTAAQPLRVAELDRLLVDSVSAVSRDGSTRLVLSLSGGAEAAATAAGLAAREAQCCRFFTFDLRIAQDGVTLSVSVPEAHADVLAALADRAGGLAGTRS